MVASRQSITVPKIDFEILFGFKSIAQVDPIWRLMKEAFHRFTKTTAPM